MSTTDTPPRRPSGRHSKATPAICQAIAQAIERGANIEAAAVAAGVAHSTVCEWLARGEGRHPRPSTPDLEAFAAAVRKAEAAFECALVARINEAATDDGGRDWRAAAWLLERRFPDRWGRRTRAEVATTVQASGSAAAALAALAQVDGPDLSAVPAAQLERMASTVH